MEHFPDNIQVAIDITSRLTQSEDMGNVTFLELRPENAHKAYGWTKFEELNELEKRLFVVGADEVIVTQGTEPAPYAVYRKNRDIVMDNGSNRLIRNMGYEKKEEIAF